MKLGIIGGGPAGYSAALRASRKKTDVTVFEKKWVGGVCLNVGCIPTKALISCAQFRDTILRFRRMGIKLKTEKKDWDSVQKYKNRARKRLVKGVEGLLRKNKIKIIEKKATLTDSGIINTEDDTYEFDKILIATGSKPNSPPFPVEGNVWYSREALNSEVIPESLIIIGAGVIGLEFGYIYSNFNTRVTLIELQDEILYGEDKESSSTLRKNLEKKGLKFHLSSRVREIKKDNENFRVVFNKNQKEEVIKAEQVLLSIGREPYIENLPENILDKKGKVRVDEFLQTDMDGIFAAGDCAGGHLLAHSAYKEAEIAVKNIHGEKVKLNETAVPRVVYTHPEMAATGLTEEELQNRNADYKKEILHFSSNGRAVASGNTSGQIKLLYNGEGEILGAYIIGSEASEMITQLSLAIKHKINVEELSEIIFPHPTLSEIIKEAAGLAAGNPLH